MEAKRRDRVYDDVAYGVVEIGDGQELPGHGYPAQGSERRRFGSGLGPVIAGKSSPSLRIVLTSLIRPIRERTSILAL
jgi:hypothetical protein